MKVQPEWYQLRMEEEENRKKEEEQKKLHMM